MRKVLKWTGMALGTLLGVLVIAATVLYFMGGSRLQRRYDIQPEALVIPKDTAAIERGRHLATAVTLCQACHAEDLAGDTVFVAPGIAAVYASNLTSGEGGIATAYSDADFVRAVRHGVNRDGRGLMIMHSDAYNQLADKDLGAIIAYVKSVAPVDRQIPPSRGGPLGRVLLPLGVFDTESMPLIPAEVIDHRAPLTRRPALGPTPEYGRYLVSIAVCEICHGSDLAGGPAVEEGAPPAANIAAWPGAWSEDEFVATIRTGVTPYGKTLHETMPWQIYANMTDDELIAIWRYIVSMAEG